MHIDWRIFLADIFSKIACSVKAKVKVTFQISKIAELDGFLTGFAPQRYAGYTRNLPTTDWKPTKINLCGIIILNGYIFAASARNLQRPVEYFACWSP
jgi:hypothetical protein